MTLQQLPISLGEPRPRVCLASSDVGEEELAAIREVFASGILTDGPWTEAFEDAFARRHEVDHAVAFANGTVALSAMYLGMGIGPGDEVITPSMTYISSATSVLHVGATPEFAEVDTNTFTLDPEDVRRRITSKTKAVLAVHYGGQPGDMDELRAVTEEAGVLLLEDAAQAHGASYHGRPAGSLGHAGMFSFTPAKSITTGEGGMVTTNDAELAARLRLLRNHGRTSRYVHEVVGWNWRISEMQAAMGVVQLDKLDGILAKKKSNAEWMAKRLAGVHGLVTPAAPADREHPYMLYTLLLDKGRDDVMARLLEAGIEARIYFPPVHTQPVFGFPPGTLAVTEELSRHMLSIPFHARLLPEELEEMAWRIEEAVDEFARGAA